MQIRDATEADLPAIVAIYNSTISSCIVTGDTSPVTVESRIPWFQAHSPTHRPLWVMVNPEQQAVMGWLGFQSFYGRPAYEITAEISLYVCPEHRRQGIGRKLLAEAIRRSPEFDLEILLGFIFGQNQPSLRLFESFGFQQWGFLPAVARFENGDRDLVIVGRRI